MFIKTIPKTDKNTGKRYDYYRLVESYKINGKPRHRTILNLGKLEELSKDKFKLLADSIEQLLKNQGILFDEDFDPEVEKYAKKYYKQIIDNHLVDIKTPAIQPQTDIPVKDIQSIDLNSIENEDAREIGAEWMSKQIIDSLDILSLFERMGIAEKQMKHCMVNWISRMVNPKSERATARWLSSNTALAELFDIKHDTINRHHLYKASSLLYSMKDKFENHLYQTTQSLFNLQDKIIIYDLTNTYFEGEKRSSKRARHGNSKEKRKDAKLISLALVVDAFGFVKYSEFYDGNISEPGTLSAILEHLNKQSRHDVGINTANKPIVIMDAGIATEKNIELLKEKQLWNIYNTLREIEETFRILKTDLSIRPVFHQEDKYTEAHLYLGILAYQIVSVIRHKLKAKGINYCWKEIVRIMNTQKAVTTSMLKKSGTKIYIRRCTKPTAEALEIYRALNLNPMPFYKKYRSPPNEQLKT